MSSECEYEIDQQGEGGSDDHHSDMIVEQHDTPNVNEFMVAQEMIIANDVEAEAEDDDDMVDDDDDVEEDSEIDINQNGNRNMIQYNDDGENQNSSNNEDSSGGDGGSDSGSEAESGSSNDDDDDDDDDEESSVDKDEQQSLQQNDEEDDDEDDEDEEIDINPESENNQQEQSKPSSPLMINHQSQEIKSSGQPPTSKQSSADQQQSRDDSVVDQNEQIDDDDDDDEQEDNHEQSEPKQSERKPRQGYEDEAEIVKNCDENGVYGWEDFQNTKVKPFSKEEYERFQQPFQYGWKRELVLRCTGNRGDKKAGDVYYHTPNGSAKLRSYVEMNLFLRRNPQITELNVTNFTFAKQPIYRPPNEIVRHAMQRGANFVERPFAFNQHIRAKQQSQQQPQSNPAGQYYQAPPNVYQPAYNCGFALPNDIFNQPPPAGFIYTSEAPPPYPGLNTHEMQKSAYPTQPPPPQQQQFGSGQPPQMGFGGFQQPLNSGGGYPQQPAFAPQIPPPAYPGSQNGYPSSGQNSQQPTNSMYPNLNNLAPSAPPL